MVNLFDSFFTYMRSHNANIVYPFHTVFMTDDEVNGEFEAQYGELDEPFEHFTHYGLYKAKTSQRLFAMPLTKEQVEKQSKV